MGFFDTFLKDIASGDLDKKLEKLADTVEKFSDKVDGSANKVVTQSEQTIKKVESVGHSATKSIDGIRKRLPES